MSRVKTWEVWGDLEEANTESCQHSCKWRYIHISFNVALLSCWICLKKRQDFPRKVKVRKVTNTWNKSLQPVSLSHEGHLDSGKELKTVVDSLLFLEQPDFFQHLYVLLSKLKVSLDNSPKICSSLLSIKIYISVVFLQKSWAALSETLLGQLLPWLGDGKNARPHQAPPGPAQCGLCGPIRGQCAKAGWPAHLCWSFDRPAHHTGQPSQSKTSHFAVMEIPSLNMLLKILAQRLFPLFLKPIQLGCEIHFSHK